MSLPRCILPMLAASASIVLTASGCGTTADVTAQPVPMPSASAARPVSTVTKEPLRLIVSYEDDAARDRILERAEQRGDEVLYRYRNISAVAISISSFSARELVLRAYRSIPGVLQVTEDQKVELH